MKEKMNKENTNFIIYKAQNILTGECYIGATTKSIQDRKQDHLQKANTGSYHKFHYAITTTGSDNFTWEQLDTASNSNELAEKETKYIYDFKAIENGYNSDRGGGIQKIIYQYDMNTKELVASYINLKSAAQSVNAKPKSISNACLGYNKTCMSYYWSYSNVVNTKEKSDTRKKQVVQYNLKREELARYISASEASRKTGVSKTCISRCCRGERDNSGGYIWNYY